jgi:hypothetical protein
MRILQGLAFACMLFVSAIGAAQAQSQPPREQGVTAPATVIAAKLRTQGHACRGTLLATRDRRASRPLGAVWDLRCSNATYRVRLIPARAAKVQHLVVWP